MSLKLRERIRTPTGPLFTSLEIRERVMALGPFFHELENMMVNMTLEGPLFTNLKKTTLI